MDALWTEPPSPMEPVAWPTGFDDAGWLWQVKWDGVRCLGVHAGGGIVRLWRRHGLPWAGAFPEVAAALPRALGNRPAVVDGELVALDAEGRPSFHLALRRALRVRPTPAVQAAIPMVYAVFDLLALDDRDVRGLPLQERLARLDDCLQGGAQVRAVHTHAGGGTTFVAAAAAAGLEGAVAKRASSAYRGGPSPEWRKVKPRRTLLATVAGFRARPGGALRALALAAFVDGTPTYLGDVGSGLSAAVAARLHALLRAAPEAEPPEGGPAVRTDGERRWVRPELVCRVGFAAFTATGRLRAPVLLDFVAVAPDRARLP